MTQKRHLLTDEHEDCPFEDCCYSPTNYECPVVRRMLKSNGLPVPSRELYQREIMTIEVGEVRNRSEYQRQYQRQYQSLSRRVTLRGVRVRKADLEILEGMEEKITRLLEDIAQEIRGKEGR